MQDRTKGGRADGRTGQAVAVAVARGYDPGIIGNVAPLNSGFRTRNNFSENYPQIWARAVEVLPALLLAEKA
jgi:hypothetical protein